MIDKVFGNKITQQKLGESNKIQIVTLEPQADIGPYRNYDNWRMWVQISDGAAVYICLKGDEFRMKNVSDKIVSFMEITGSNDYTFEKLCEIISPLGFSSMNRVSSNQELIIR